MHSGVDQDKSKIELESSESDKEGAKDDDDSYFSTSFRTNNHVTFHELMKEKRLAFIFSFSICRSE